MKLNRELRRQLRPLRSVRACQRRIARYLVARIGLAKVEELRRLCRQARVYDSAHFRGYMEGFGACYSDGKLLGWYTTRETR